MGATKTSLGTAINLMEAFDDSSPNQLPPEAGWFNQSRFGMFVHYGLYTLHGREEWAMFHEKIPPQEYNKLADEFTAENFDADEIVKLAKDAGAGYVVLGARHHEGFCLWDTKTTDFSSVKTAAGRDLIAEYVEACRRHGLRVGIYYSIMSWQWPAIFTGPIEDPEGWENMVNETHEQLRELMTDYGRIDYLWYDGCVVPGMGESSLRAHYWKSKALNDGLRILQPHLLINNRSALPEDVMTVEQHLSAPPAGRLWEFCQTIGRTWGWVPEDSKVKSASELLQTLIFCASHGGNYLLNIGPRPDGSIEEAQIQRMREIGEWMTHHGESVRGSERTAYSEAKHLIGPATCRGRNVYFHIKEWPEEPVRVAGITSPVVSAFLRGTDEPLQVEQHADGVVILRGFPVLPTPENNVLQLTLTDGTPTEPPPSLLIEEDTGKRAIAEAPVLSLPDAKLGRSLRLSFEVPANGLYHLDLELYSSAAQSVELHLDNGGFLCEVPVSCGQYPMHYRSQQLSLNAGTHEFCLRASKSDFKLQRWRLQPVWRNLPPNLWQTVGAFPTRFAPRGKADTVKEALLKDYGPESNPVGPYDGVRGSKVHWKNNTQNDREDVCFALLLPSEQQGVCYARTHVISPDARELDVLISCDWWANLYVNGKLIESEREPAMVEIDGAYFNGWKPMPVRVSLCEGENEFLLKCHPGATNNWFVAHINDPGDILVKPSCSEE